MLYIEEYMAMMNNSICTKNETANLASTIQDLVFKIEEYLDDIGDLLDRLIYIPEVIVIACAVMFIGLWFIYLRGYRGLEEKEKRKRMLYYIVSVAVYGCFISYAYYAIKAPDAYGGSLAATLAKIYLMMILLAIFVVFYAASRFIRWAVKRNRKPQT